MKSSSIDQLIGSRIRELRRQQGLSAEDLSSKVELTQRQLLNIEAGLVRLSAGALIEISEVLQLPIEAFFPAVDQPDKETSISESTSDLKAELKAAVDAIDSPEKLSTAKFVLKRLASV